MREFLPIARWLPAYRRADLRYDVIAGVTVSALVVPKAWGTPGSPGPGRERALRRGRRRVI